MTAGQPWGRKAPSPWPLTRLGTAMFSNFCVCRKYAKSVKSGLSWTRAGGWVALAGRPQGQQEPWPASLLKDQTLHAPGLLPLHGQVLPGLSLLWPYPANSRWRPQCSP